MGLMKIINLSTGHKIFVDDSDYETLNQYHWWVNGDGYAIRSRLKTDGMKTRGSILMHHQVIRPVSGCDIDHINGNPLDNRRCNLRIATRSQNNMNRFHKLPNASSKYKGVCWRSIPKLWKAYIKINKRQIHIGYFRSEVAAAIAYNQAAIKYFGEFARLNEIKDISHV